MYRDHASYAAALKLLRFALRLDKVRYCSEAEEALGIAMRPLLHGLADVVGRYLEGHPDSPQVTLARFLQTEDKPRPALVNQIW